MPRLPSAHHRLIRMDTCSPMKLHRIITQDYNTELHGEVLMRRWPTLNCASSSGGSCGLSRPSAAYTCSEACTTSEIMWHSSRCRDAGPPLSPIWAPVFTSAASSRCWWPLQTQVDADRRPTACPTVARFLPCGDGRLVRD